MRWFNYMRWFNPTDATEEPMRAMRQYAMRCSTRCSST
ncbi:hypothetical protein XOCgx_2321 [Xanthomonas oryzae pv. oryzicola]|nr:hypothetical protein XOCgx_2321 [Xanthomonas oryzae pv. oryzicola]